MGGPILGVMRAPSRWLQEAQPSALTRIDRQVSARGGAQVVCLHQGKTAYGPAVGPPQDGEGCGLAAHEHAPPAGARPLRESLARHAGRLAHREVDPDDVVVTAGATGGIAAALRCVLEPGDEVLVPSPQWLFATGVIRAAGGVPVEVPVFLELAAVPAFDLGAALGGALTGRTRAIYFNDPNNPTGQALGPDGLAALVGFAARHDLWLIADNAYEHYDFSPAGFLPVAALPGAAERTFSVHTFSKSYGMPGYRVGYVVAPPGLGQLLVRSVLYGIYSVATLSQAAALRALDTPGAELERRRARAAAAWSFVHETLEVPHTAVDGGLYTFLDLRGLDRREGGGTAGFLEGCLAAGVALAPGVAFGGHCQGWARLCFTAVGERDLELGVERVNKVWRELAA